MYKIVAVENKRDLRRFIQFQLDLYKDCPYFVPTLISDEMKNLDPKRSPFMGEDAEAQCFLCEDDGGKIVGRVCVILSHLYNNKNNEKRVRISRLDFIDDREVVKLLLDTAEEWGREHGMEVIHGPLGFTDMEREGLLIEGFDLMSTYNTQYYYPYYQGHIEALGYKKEVDWIEERFHHNENSDGRVARLSQAVSKRLKIHELEVKSVSWLAKNYFDAIFDLFDEAYGGLYGTVPITEKVRKSMLGQFKLVLNKDLISILVDENNNVIAVGLMLPCISQSVHDIGGKLFPFGWIKVLREIKNFSVIEMALIGVKKEYQDKGVTAIIFHKVLERMQQKFPNYLYCETNLQLEENYKIQQLFAKDFDVKLVRRRRCYYKSLNGKPVTLHKALSPIEPPKEAE